MKFCKHCGTELSQGAKFCKNCGASLASDSGSPEMEEDAVSEGGPDQTSSHSDSTMEQEETVESGQDDGVDESGGAEEAEDAVPDTSASEEETSSGESAESTYQQPDDNGKKGSGKIKLFASIIGALIIVVVAGYFVGGYLLAPEKQIERFEAAIEEDDAGTVSDMLVASDGDLDIDESSVQGLIDYLNENDGEMDYLIDHLEKQTDQDATVDENYAINLVQDGKQYFVYDDHDIEVSPIYFNVRTNYADTDILMNGEKITTADTDDFTEELGPFLPGKYSFEAELETSAIDLSAQENREHFDPDEPEQVDLFMEGEEITINAPYEGILDDVTMYIDGEDTGLNVIEDNEFGPVTLDGSMTASFEAEFPWGTMQTDEIPLESGQIDVIFQADNGLQENIQDRLIQFHHEYLETYTTADSDKMTVATNEVAEDIAEQAEFEKENDTFYQGRFTGIDFYEGSFVLDHTGDAWIMSVDTLTMYDENLEYDPEEDDEDDLEETVEEFGYELGYDEREDEWIVAYIGFADYMEEDRMVEHREDDPELFTSEWAEDSDDDS